MGTNTSIEGGRDMSGTFGTAEPLQEEKELTQQVKAARGVEEQETITVAVSLSRTAFFWLGYLVGSLFTSAIWWYF